MLPGDIVMVLVKGSDTHNTSLAHWEMTAEISTSQHQQRMDGGPGMSAMNGWRLGQEWPPPGHTPHHLHDHPHQQGSTRYKYADCQLGGFLLFII